MGEEGVEGKAVLVGVDEEVLKKRNVPLIATELVDNFIKIYNGKWFVNGDKDLGIYCWDGRRYYECETLMYEFVEMNYRSNEMDVYGIKRTSLFKEFMIGFKGYGRYEVSYEPLAVSYNNVVIDWEGLLSNPISDVKTFKQHSPENIVYHHIPHDINVELVKVLFKIPALDEKLIQELAEKHTPKTLNAFQEWVGEKWLLLYEMIGVVLLPKPVKKAFLLIGDTDTGKSTYIRLHQRLIGRENYAAISLQELTNPEYRFRAARIYRKLANYYPDLPNEAVRNPGAFKVITGEDTITIERKHREPFEWMPYTKHFFSANEPPPVFYADRAFWNRWVVAEFIGNFKSKVKDFELTLLDEAPNILAVATLALLNLVRRGWVFSFENTAEDAKRKWMMASDSVYAFIVTKLESGELVEDPEAMTANQELHNMYVDWCNENGLTPVDVRAFPGRLTKLFGFKTKRSGGKTYIIGLRRGSEKMLEEYGGRD